jgi:FkbM family methyltransferase
VPISSGEIITNIVRFKNYQFSLFQREICTLASCDPLFINVGANVGTTLLNARAAGFARMVAFEPVTKNFSLLKKNMEMNSIQVQALNKGLSDVSMFRAINLHPKSCGKHSLSAHSDSGRKEKIELVTLDDYIEKVFWKETKVVVWVDVEGHELEVLLGGAKDDKGSCNWGLCRSVAGDLWH